ncbi:hypothetical protein JMJ77_0002363 [Colletotrichum scovillei]|uniref:Uncharacterized protein n=1 Tax=Colletotrichum scovillei TaxID=1209932 RepID=A0A9P7RAJ7_9PEZI|nr:hypothetical protein JMJ77_0002363 [Colletotrichum scovillei]KAG7070782.1 hypothetical protein JMJ76_0002028 [Colletotrichum scovillei]KAG7078993.1 hypothetical protein JMJ78_0002655 [Colletotrichum scovillei]
MHTPERLGTIWNAVSKASRAPRPGEGKFRGKKIH